VASARTTWFRNLYNHLNSISIGMRYLVDNMFNGLMKEFSKRDIDCATVIHEIWNDDDSSIGGRWDARIFRFLLEKKYDLVPKESVGKEYMVITADNDLERYCREFGLGCRHIPQPKPLSKVEYKELATTLADELIKSLSQKRPKQPKLFDGPSKFSA
jgi:hypothetical protein